MFLLNFEFPFVLALSNMPLLPVYLAHLGSLVVICIQANGFDIELQWVSLESFSTLLSQPLEEVILAHCTAFPF